MPIFAYLNYGVYLVSISKRSFLFIYLVKNMFYITQHFVNMRFVLCLIYRIYYYLYVLEYSMIIFNEQNCYNKDQLIVKYPFNSLFHLFILFKYLQSQIKKHYAKILIQKYHFISLFKQFYYIILNISPLNFGLIMVFNYQSIFFSNQ